MVNGSNLEDSICNMMAVTQDVELVNSLEKAFHLVSKTTEHHGELFNKDLQVMKYAKDKKGNIYTITEKPYIASVALKDNKNNEIVVSWKQFVREYRIYSN